MQILGPATGMERKQIEKKSATSPESFPWRCLTHKLLVRYVAEVTQTLWKKGRAIALTVLVATTSACGGDGASEGGEEPPAREDDGGDGGDGDPGGDDDPGADDLSLIHI